MSDRLALLERAQQGDGSAEAQLLTENAGLIWSIVHGTLLIGKNVL